MACTLLSRTLGEGRPYPAVLRTYPWLCRGRSGNAYFGLVVQFICFGAIHSNSQSLLLPLNSGIIPSRAQGCLWCWGLTLWKQMLYLHCTVSLVTDLFWGAAQPNVRVPISLGYKRMYKWYFICICYLWFWGLNTLGGLWCGMFLFVLTKTCR